ncbi:hypothetical protein [Priestia aryabhattai]|uniref:hypothetical protein n=1 Tax=Priestia aryabhattai TaxID=412384 RepID=UPI001C8EE347|nr:hypothetical protein [Priestia aryabhattai]MBX9987164.1 hypothetical protein [Priestia aryabhattai]
MNIITSISNQRELFQISGISLDEKQKFYVWRLNFRSPSFQIAQIDKVMGIRKSKKKRKIAQDISNRMRINRLRHVTRSHFEQFLNTFLLQVDYSYYPLFSLIKRHLGEEYILDIFKTLDNQIFKNEGHFLKVVGEQAVSHILEREANQKKSNEFIRELNLSYTLENSIPYHNGKVEIHKSSDSIKKEIDSNIMQFIPTNRNQAVDIDNEFGYHFHHCIARGGKYIRTKILLTFNPKGSIHPTGGEQLFWEEHGPYLKIQIPGKSKREKIYHECNKVRVTKGQSVFRNPSEKKAQHFFPL